MKILEMPAAILERLVPRAGEALLGLYSNFYKPSLSSRGLLPKLERVAYFDVVRLLDEGRNFIIQDVCARTCRGVWS